MLPFLPPGPPRSLQVLVGLGSALAYAAGGRDLALPFALGGASGMLYQYMLQVGCRLGLSRLHG